MKTKYNTINVFEKLCRESEKEYKSYFSMLRKENVELGLSDKFNIHFEIEYEKF